MEETKCLIFQAWPKYTIQRDLNEKILADVAELFIESYNREEKKH